MRYTLNEEMRWLVDRACYNESLMDGTTEQVMKVLAAADLVWAVFPDEEVGRVGALVIKGYDYLARVGAIGENRLARVNAILTTNRHTAVSLWQDMGDGARGRPMANIHWFD